MILLLAIKDMAARERLRLAGSRISATVISVREGKRISSEKELGPSRRCIAVVDLERQGEELPALVKRLRDFGANLVAGYHSHVNREVGEEAKRTKLFDLVLPRSKALGDPDKFLERLGDKIEREG